ncbi:roadblock/LC7 domain-containing protein [Streptomyces sp. NBC_00828]|uniref:roadblock/LC7 domain-containing protein n=1 Tax=Streptomyces sp. NBC_00828 TaxID=2903678 RepID=UPI003869D4C7
MTHDTPRPEGGDTMTAAAYGPDDPSRQMAGMLTEFVDRVPGVTHALLISRDGLRLVDSGMHRDWADKWAATLGTLASLAENIPGPRGGKAGMKQTVVERVDGMLFVSIAGTSAVFPNQPGNTEGVVDTVLAVITEPQASAGTVGYEMGVLVDRFAPYMVAAVRSA